MLWRPELYIIKNHMAQGLKIALAALTVLLFGPSTRADTFPTRLSLYPRLGYDPRTDFEPIGLISFSPIILFSRKDLPVGNFSEFLAYAKAQGDKLSDGHSGVGSISHITCALLASLGGYSPTFVPYRGVGPMINDMLGGNVDFGCDLVPAVSQHIKARKLKGIAIASAERSPALPDVPTSSAGGFAEFRADAWTGLFAPRGVPIDILDKLRNALVESLDNPQTQSRLVSLGAVVPKPEERTAPYLAQLVRDEITRWGKVIKDAGIEATP